MSLVNKVLKSYTRIPLWLTNLLAPIYYLIPEKYRYGAVYRSETAELQRINALSAAEASAERDAALKKLVNYAYIHVPYYHRIFDENGLRLDCVNCVSDLKKLPFLTKEELVLNQNDLISDEFSKDELVYLTTSGSTGEPTGFYVQKESPMREWVYPLQMFRQFDYHPDSSKLVMRGKVFWAQREKGKSWQWDAFKRELSINIFDMTPQNMEAYCNAIEKYKPDFAFGYMSAMYTLCKYIKTRSGGLRHHFKGYMGISETIMPEQREFVESVIQARVFSFYGMSERVIIAGECKDSTEYHVEPMYGVAELVDSAGNVITEAGAEGELVGTSLLSYAMPIIRYKTGDISAWSDKADCPCGSCKERLKYVSGRWKHDSLVGSNGALISMTAINMHSEIFSRIIRYQLFQDKIGFVTIKVIASNNFSDEDKLELIRQFTEKTQSKITYDLIVVNAIPPKPNGKLSLVDQRLDVSKYL